MDEINKEEELYIPVNIPESRAADYFSGFGSKELMTTLITFFASIIVAVIIYKSTNQLTFAAIIGIGIVGIVVLIIKRDQFDESLIDKVKIVQKFRKTQKQYEYEYYNIYEG